MNITTILIVAAAIALMVIIYWVYTIIFPSKTIALWRKPDLEFEPSRTNKGHYLVFDVETNGLPKSYTASPENTKNWPRVVQLAWMLFDKSGGLIDSSVDIIRGNFAIPIETSDIHGVTKQISDEQGVDILTALDKFKVSLDKCQVIVAHNMDFDYPIVQAEFIRLEKWKSFAGKKLVCTMAPNTELVGIPKIRGNGYKFPKLTELYGKLFYQNPYKPFNDLGIHNALVDVKLTAKCFFWLMHLDYGYRFEKVFLRP
jgi:DNA polymerase III alpha subunit (gram-positive type)